MNYSNHTYYAHSMHIYGSDREKLERDLLIRLGFNVCCPNRDLSLGNDMDAYLSIVKQCKSVVASEFAGFIGRGVYLEVSHALRHDIPVFVIRHSILYKVVKIVFFNENDWKTTYGQITEVESLKITA